MRRSTDSLWEIAPHFQDAISSAIQSVLGATPAIGNVAADAIQGAALGAGAAALTGQKPLVGAGLGALAGGAYGAYNNMGDLTGTSALTTIPSGSSDASNMAAQYAQGNGQSAITNSLGASGIDAVGGNPGSLDAGSVAGQAASNATGAGNSVTKGIPGGINTTALALGALSALASAGSKPKQGNWPTPGPSSMANAAYFNTPLNTNFPGRTAVTPSQTTMPTGAQPNYWSYGGPEQSYFSNNSAASYGFARGGAPHGEWEVNRNGPHVQGPGTGTSDSIPAMLSKGEYILTARDVARIGGGSNERGARILDTDRSALAKIVREPQFVKQTNGPLGSVTRRAPK